MGLTSTTDQKLFSITGDRPVRLGTPLKIQFFVQYSELDEIPQIKRVYVDGTPTCVSGLLTRFGGFDVTTESPGSGPIYLEHLPLLTYPSISQSPTRVDNVSSTLNRQVSVKHFGQTLIFNSLLIFRQDSSAGRRAALFI